MNSISKAKTKAYTSSIEKCTCLPKYLTWHEALIQSKFVKLKLIKVVDSFMTSFRGIRDFVTAANTPYNKKTGVKIWMNPSNKLTLKLESKYP